MLYGRRANLVRAVLTGRSGLLSIKNGELGVRFAMGFKRGVAAAVILTVISSAASAATKRVLLLHSFGREFAPFSEFSTALRQDLIKLASPDSVDFYEASIEAARFRDSRDEAPFIEYLHALFAERTLDLIVTIGGPAAQFGQRHRAQLFPFTPMLIAATAQQIVDPAALAANDAAVTVKFDWDGLIENIINVFPKTNNIAVVAGDSPIERYWVEEFKRAFRPYAGRMNFTWLNKLSHEELLKTVAALPPRSAIVYLNYWVDADGVPYEGEQVLSEINANANAPTFSYVDAFLGRGIVGGPLLSLSAISLRTAEVAVRVLAGEFPPERTISIGAGAPEFDSRQLRRWNVAESRLPSGSTVKFVEPSIWMQYRGYILAVTALVLVQALIISRLLLEQSRRRLAERELVERVLEVGHLNRAIVANALSGSIAHELVQPLGAVHSDTETAEILLALETPDIEQVKAIVGHIRTANTRAVEIIQHFRQLLKRPSEIDSQELDLNEVIADAVCVISVEADKRGVAFDLTGAGQHLLVRGDRIQLQQVVLILAMNGMDAMADVAADTRRIKIRSGVVDNSKAEVSITDWGIGIPQEKLREVFNFFYTTKQNGNGFGLSIARTIIETHGGEIWAESGPRNGGATFRFTLPLARANSP